MMPVNWPAGLLSRRTAPRRRAERNRFRFIAETLEPRILLSGRGVGPNVPAEVSAQPAADDASDANDMDLTIVGTTVGFDAATGLPAYMAGDMYYSDGSWAGRYEEHLTPVLHPEYGFVGTIGVSTFCFMNESGKMTFGEVTTENYSQIVGMDPETGAVQVVSSGEITGGVRHFGGVSGGISSASTVVLGPQFTLEVQLSLEYSHQPVHGANAAGGSRGGPAEHPVHSYWSEPDDRERDEVFAHWKAA